MQKLILRYKNAGEDSLPLLFIILFAGAVYYIATLLRVPSSAFLMEEITCVVAHLPSRVGLIPSSYFY